MYHLNSLLNFLYRFFWISVTKLIFFSVQKFIKCRHPIKRPPSCDKISDVENIWRAVSSLFRNFLNAADCIVINFARRSRCETKKSQHYIAEICKFVRIQISKRERHGLTWYSISLIQNKISDNLKNTAILFFEFLASLFFWASQEMLKMHFRHSKDMDFQ